MVVTTHDEIGVLANAFNQMAEALEKRISERAQAQEALSRANNELEQRVGERTAQLVAEIGERKEAEQAARESEAQLNAYFDASPAGMALVDPQLRYLKANQRLADMTGVSIEAHLGKTVREILPRLADILEPLYQEVFATGKPILNFELSGKYIVPRSTATSSFLSFPLMGEEAKPKAVGVVAARNHRAKTRRGGAELRQNGRRSGQPRQERIPGEHEPRDPHAHERRDRNDRAAAGYPAHG